MSKDNQSICETDRFRNKRWLYNDQYHREDGPALEYNNGDKCWYLYGKLHRLDGPAIDWAYIAKEWHYHGEWIDCDSQEEFERLIKLKALW